MTDDRKRKTGGEVELLVLPVAAHQTHPIGTLWTAEQMRDYARANVDRALAESRAEVERLRKDTEVIANDLATLSVEMTSFAACWKTVSMTEFNHFARRVAALAPPQSENGEG